MRNRGLTEKFERSAGLSLLEMTITIVCLSIFMGGVASALFRVEDAYAESEFQARVVLQAERALGRLNELVSQAVTTDDDFALIDTEDGLSAGVAFRLLDSVTDADLTYDDLNVFILGPTDGASECEGLVVGRGTTLASVHGIGAGADDVLGTLDDDTRTSANNTIPAIEILIPSTFAPREGSMFSVEPAAGNTRLLVFTLRLNLQGAGGTFELPEDLEITEEIALRQ